MKTLIIVTHPYIEKLLRPFELLAGRACSSCLHRPITAIIITNEKIIFNLIIQFGSEIV